MKSSPRENLIGMGLMIIAMGLFTLEDALIKHLTKTLATGEILILIGIGGTLVFFSIAKAKQQRFEGDLIKTPAVIIRTLAELFGTACFVASLAMVPLSLISTIIQVVPLLVTLGAAVFLGESVGFRRWAAIFVGLFGVILILRPTGTHFEPAIILTVLGVIGLAVRDVATKRIPQTASTVVLATFGFGATIPAGLILMAFSGGWSVPTLAEFSILAAGVAIAMVAYYAIITATRIGEMSVVTPFRYSRLIFGIIAGVVFFGESLDFYTILGGLIIVAAGLYTFWRERVAL